MDFMFFVNSVLLGVGLAMDAFSVSLANGLNEPGMRRKRMCAVAGVFSFFQMLMPLIGWFLVRTMISCFAAISPFIPWIALFLLAFIGAKMIIEGLKKKATDEKKETGLGALLLQGVATSIDALSVGFTISEYKTVAAILACAIIGAVTFAICVCGIYIGKKFGTKISDKASVFGGIILIVIGLEIFITGIM